MTEDDVTEIKVSQQAREAAAERFDAAFGPTELTREMRQGLHDCDPMVQAFARFEQAVRADERERAAKRADYECEIAQDNLNENYDIAFNRPAEKTARRTAAAIRAQGDEA